MAGQRKGKLTTILLALGILLLIGAAGLQASRIVSGQMAQSRSDEVMSKMDVMIPRYDEGDASATGRGEDPLPVIEIEGTDFAGYLEIPSQDLKLPVAAETYDGRLFAFIESGSPVKGHFRIGGRDIKGVFGKIDEIRPSETVTFVDVNGIRYTYKVTGLGSVRVGEKQDHDLMLLRGVSKSILFAVFGKMI